MDSNELCSKPSAISSRHSWWGLEKENPAKIQITPYYTDKVGKRQGKGLWGTRVRTAERDVEGQSDYLLYFSMSDLPPVFLSVRERPVVGQETWSKSDMLGQTGSMRELCSVMGMYFGGSSFEFSWDPLGFYWFV